MRGKRRTWEGREEDGDESQEEVGVAHFLSWAAGRHIIVCGIRSWKYGGEVGGEKNSVRRQRRRVWDVWSIVWLPVNWAK